MRRNHVATALIVLSAGLTASAAVRRVLSRRRAAGSRFPATAAPSAAPAVTTTAATVEPAPADDAVVLPFTRRTGSAPAAAAQPLTAVRCGDAGGRTKAGAPCAARATSNGRCHHHRVAA